MKPKKEIISLHQIQKQDNYLVGGKAINLGLMFDQFPIPKGFCITIEAYKKFIDKASISDSESL